MIDYDPSVVTLLSCTKSRNLRHTMQSKLARAAELMFTLWVGLQCITLLK
jgi:hypothetical protein